MKTIIHGLLVGILISTIAIVRAADSAAKSKPATAAPVAAVEGPSTPEQELEKRLEAIKLPKVEFENATIDDVVKFLAEHVRFEGALQGGVGRLQVRSAGLKDSHQKISINIRDVSLLNLVRFVALELGLKCHILANGVVLAPADYFEPDWMVTRIFKVQAGVFASVLTTSSNKPIGSSASVAKPATSNELASAPAPSISRSELKKLFSDAGVKFPPGASIDYDQTTNALIITNTRANQDAMEQMFSSLGIISTQVELNVAFVAFPLKEVDAMACKQGELAATQEQLKEAWRNGRGRLLSRSKVVTISGQQAKAEGIAEVIYPTEYEPPHDLFPTASGFQTRNVGTSLNVTPQVGADEFTISLTLMFELSEVEWRTIDVSIQDGSRSRKLALQQPTFHTRRLTTSVTAWDGQTVVIGGMPNRNAQEVVYVFLTPMLVNPAGSLVHPTSQRMAEVVSESYFQSPAADRIKEQEIGRKLESIKLAEVTFEAQPLPAVLRILADQVRVADLKWNHGSGFAISLIGLQGEPPKISLKLQQASLRTILLSIAAMTGLKVQVTAVGVRLMPADYVDTSRLVIKNYRIQAGVFASVLTIGPGGPISLSPTEGPVPAPAPTPARGAGEVISNEDVRRFFVDAGVPFPLGTKISYDDRINTLFVANTPENIEIFEKVLSSLNIIPNQVELDTLFVAFSKAEMEQLVRQCGQPMPGQEPLRAARLAGKGRVIACSKVLTISGQQAKSEGVAEVVYPTEYEPSSSKPSDFAKPVDEKKEQPGSKPEAKPDPKTAEPGNKEAKGETKLPEKPGPEKPKSTPGSRGNASPFPLAGGFQTRNCGATLNVTPQVGADGYTISLTLIPEYNELEWTTMDTTIREGSRVMKLALQQPRFHSRRVTTSVTIWDGQTLVLGGMPNRQETETVFVFVSARLLNPAGEQIHQRQSPSSKK